MVDWAHKWTDKQLEELEKRFQSVYAQAEKEVSEKFVKHMESFSAKDEAKKKLLEAGKITQTDYNNWRLGQATTGKRWKKLRDNLAREYTNANQIAMSAISGHLPDVYAQNVNWGMYQIESGNGIGTSFSLYDRQTVERLVRDNPNLLPQPSVDIPKDLRWNSQKITSAVTQGILQGESIPKIAMRMQNVTDMNNSAAVRNARTAMTGAQNAGRVDSYKRAEDMGIELEQEWLATLDGRTRHSHRKMDGKRVKVGEKFQNGCEYPGDPSGPPEEVYNCRCTLIAALDGFTHDASDFSLRYNDNIEDMSYEDWKDYKNEREKQLEDGAKVPFEPTPRDSEGYGISSEDGSYKTVKLYHGSFADFDEFDFVKGKQFKPGGADAYGEGFYFTPNIEQAKLYGDIIYEVEIKYSTDRRTAKKTGRQKDFDYNKNTGYWIIPKEKKDNIHIVAKKRIT